MCAGKRVPRNPKGKSILIEGLDNETYQKLLALKGKYRARSWKELMRKLVERLL